MDHRSTSTSIPLHRAAELTPNAFRDWLLTATSEDLSGMLDYLAARFQPSHVLAEYEPPSSLGRRYVHRMAQLALTVAEAGHRAVQQPDRPVAGTGSTPVVSDEVVYRVADRLREWNNREGFVFHHLRERDIDHEPYELVVRKVADLLREATR